MNARVLEAIKKSAAVPSIPQVVVRFLEIIQDPHFDYDEVIKVVSADPGAVSEILRLSNSALFGIRQKIVSLRQALTLLGPKRTRSLLLGRYLVDSVSKRQPPGLDMTYFWRRSLTSSVLASRFADVLLPTEREEVFIAALLADIGIPILADALPDTYAVILKEYAPGGKYMTALDEQSAVEATHGEVSAMVLTHWMLPETVATAVNLHQSENPGHDDVATIARILHAADCVGRLLCDESILHEAPNVCVAAAEHLGIDVGVLTRVLPTVAKDIEELANALRVNVNPSNVYALVAKTIQEKLCAVPAA